MRILHPFGFLVLTSLASAQGAASDTFDRPDSSDLGPDWIQAEGGAEIRNNSFYPNRLLFSWAMNTGIQAAYVDQIVRFDFDMNGGGSELSAIAGAGITPTTWEGIEARLCDCDADGRVESILFNAAPNAGWWPTPGSCCPVTYSLATPITAGTLTLYFEDRGDTAVATVSSPLGGTEVFRAGGILSWELGPGVPLQPPMGLHAGIGFAGSGMLVDDFRVWAGSPDSTVYTMNPPRAGSKVTFLITDATPANVVGLFYSVTGFGPIPTQYGPLLLSAPFAALGVLPTDARGRAEVSLPNVSPRLQGLVLYNQAFDAGSLTFSNAFAVRFQ